MLHEFLVVASAFVLCFVIPMSFPPKEVRKERKIRKEARRRHEQYRLKYQGRLIPGLIT